MKSFGRRQFGETHYSESHYRRTASNRRYYIPSVAEIRRKCALVRERWDKVTAMERKGSVGV